MAFLLTAVTRIGRVALCLLAFSSAAVADIYEANDVDFLNLMGNAEGYRGFGTTTDYATHLPPEDIKTMRIAEVLAYQQSLRTAGARSSAVGRYQFIYKTLSSLVQELEISGELVFDEEVQTWLARELMRRCGFYDRDMPVEELGNCLASKWAALPRLSGPGVGDSAYHGDGLNRAHVPVWMLRAVLENRFTW